ncbi:reverse transcriptase domain-containing protein [Tanacetum coccineum]
MVSATTHLIGFSGETIWPLGQIALLVKIGNEVYSTSAWMNFMVIRSPSQHNAIIGRPGIKKIRALPSTAHGMLKFPIEGGTEEKINFSNSPGVPEQGQRPTKHRGTLLEYPGGIFAGYAKEEKRTGAQKEIRHPRRKWKKLVDAGIMKEVHLSNSLAIYSRQIGRNLEAYVDDLVIKSRTEEEIVRDITETFKTLRQINMKLNPKKCTFGMQEGMFLGYKVSTNGLKACPDKADAVLSLPSPRCIKDVQKLNGKLASLNRFLSKSAEKSLPFFKTLKNCTKKSDFQWTPEAEEAFKQMKKLIAELPTLTAPREREELIIYLAAAKEAISAVLMTDREGRQIPVYFVSRTLRGPEVNYTPMEKLVLALLSASKRLKDYFKHTRSCNNKSTDKATVVKFGNIREDAEVEVRWKKKVTHGCTICEYLHKEILPEDTKKARAVRRKVVRYAMINGTLYKKSFLGPWLRCVGPLQANYVLREIHEGSCSMHSGPRSVVAKNWPTRRIISDMKAVVTIHLMSGARNCASAIASPLEKHPQANGLVERANRSLGEGIKARLEEKSKDWIEELPHVLWAHRTMIKSSNGETPFSLTYGTEAVIPAEIGIETLRNSEMDQSQNNEALGINIA